MFIIQQDLDNLLEELLSWLEGLENTLNGLQAESLPDNHSTLELLVSEHREFMENTARRQNEVDRICKARQIKPVKDSRKILKSKLSTLVYVCIKNCSFSLQFGII
jgi:dystonin